MTNNWFKYNLFNDRLTEIIKKNPDLMDKWVLVVSACHQYAPGICGQNFYANIVFKEFDPETLVVKGFDKKGDWRRALDPKYARDLTKKKIKGEPSPYGEVGAHYRVTETHRFKDIVRPYNDGSGYYFVELNHYFHYSTPRAIDARQHVPEIKNAPSAPSAIFA